ncbi:hypothetical protein GCM10025883_06690 [Mobilicoccus caccae]|uniref:Uncharacterized protein n=1 Tax=Mobilicoccus caccae TaxID=1859295 RepID=A0ABQ6IPI4_9MICO|nr:hypothetical protein [Mobilicoccus caccae]GMA38624.1 hypothetical protein GCM10025883_06690 [Mobilicoccus caccae]
MLPLHHTFVEILTEYGLLVFVPFVVVLVMIAWRAVRIPRRASTLGRPTSLDDAGARYLTFVFFVGFVMAGVVTSSALRWTPWWLMLASLVVLAWHLRLRTRRAP